MIKLVRVLLLAGIVAGCALPTGMVDSDGSQSQNVSSDTRALDFPVIFVSARALLLNDGVTTSVSREFTLKTKTMVPEALKTVVVHHQSLDGTWIDIPAVLSKNVEPGFQLWVARYNWNDSEGLYPLGSQFCIKYTSGTSVYWDNNSGRNFSLAKDGGFLLGTSVNLLQSYAYYESSVDGLGLVNIRGQLNVKNIAYTKVIKVHYTLDAWKTVNTINAGYNETYYHDGATPIPSPNSNAVELWTWVLPLEEPSIANLEYVLSYTVAGKTYWDNNCGFNFKAVDLAHW